MTSKQNLNPSDEKEFSSEPIYPIPGRIPLYQTALEAVSCIKSNDRVFLHGGAATPFPLVTAMARFGKENKIENVEVIHIHTEGPAEHVKPEYRGIFRDNSLFVGSNVRKCVQDGMADYVPIFLSEIPLLFKRKVLTLDVALIQVSPPDKNGFCTLGPSVDIARAAILNAKKIIGLINPQMPRTFGDSVIHMSHFHAITEDNFPLPELKAKAPSPKETAIGRIIAQNLVEDGATLQMGIGSIPDAVLSQLHNHKDLGIHSEMFSDGILPLINEGVITNAHKKFRTGKILGSFVIGTKKIFDFLNDNHFVVLCDIGFVNDPRLIALNPKMTAINSCIEIDITGQVVSDSIGSKIYSGVGGQVDFIRGAGLGEDGRGKPIIALTSTTKNGESKIVPFLKEGAGVVTSRAHVHYVVTEYGCAYLFGKNLRQRSYELINIAHPNHRKWLEQECFKRMKCMPSL
ncbi:unnamed protein product [Gordionus sp. m RMFG-2023]